MAVNIQTPNREKAVFIIGVIHSPEILMQSIFTWVNFITTYCKIGAQHKASTFMSLPVVDNVRFNIL